MNIEVRCNNCDKILMELNTTIVPGMNTLRIDVEPCGSKKCADCEHCEDMELLPEVQKELKELKAKVARGNPFEVC